MNGPPWGWGGEPPASGPTPAGGLQTLPGRAQQMASPGLGAPVGGELPASGPTPAGSVAQLQELAARQAMERRASAAGYLGRVVGGESVALPQQQLALGGLLQQQTAAGVAGPLAQRAAMYGQARAADQMLAQAARQRAQEQMAAQAMLQQAYGAEGAQRMQAAQQLTQVYGIARQEQVAREQRFAQEAAAEEAFIRQAIGLGLSAAAAPAAMMSDRALKTDVRRPRTAQEEALYKALMGGV